MEEVQLTFDTTGMQAGRHLLFVRGTDTDGNTGVVAAAFLDVIRVGPFKANRDGVLICLLGALLAAPLFPPLAVVLVLGGLWMSEHALIRAGQLPPLS